MDNKVETSKIKVGDIMAFVYWVTVDQCNMNGQQLIVKDVENDSAFQIQGKELIERGFSADQYSTTEKVTKTKAAETLVSSHNRPLTVNFIKADGSERTMRCRLVQPEPLLGRSMVEDFESKDKQHRLKQVDHRTIQWIIVDGVKYEVKS